MGPRGSGLVVTLSLSVQRVLEVAIAQHCEKCWKQAEQNVSVAEPTQKPRRGRGIPSDVADHTHARGRMRKFADAYAGIDDAEQMVGKEDYLDLFSGRHTSRHGPLAPAMFSLGDSV